MRVRRRAACRARGGRPARKSRAVMARLPSGWSSRTRSDVPSPHATTSRSPCASSDRARARRRSTAPSATATRAQERQTLRRPACVRASGHGCSPRTKFTSSSRRPRPVDQPVLLGRARRVGHEALVLRHLDRPASRNLVQRLHQQRCAERPRGRVRRRQPCRRGRSSRTTGHQHRAGIERLDHAHDGDAGLARRQPSPRAGSVTRPRQRGSSEACTLIMPRRGISRNTGGQDLPVGGDDAEVRRERAHLVEEPRLPAVAPVASTARRPVRPRTFTGGGCRRWPRPFGRSGCVTTPTTWCVEARSASSVGTANSGVPRNSTRRRRRVAHVHHFPSASACRCRRSIMPTLDGTQAIHEQAAVEMIHLVLQRPGEQAAALDRRRACRCGRGPRRPRASGARPWR